MTDSSEARGGVSRRRKLTIAIIVVAIVLVGGGAAAAFWLAPQPKPAAEAAPTPSPSATPTPTVTPTPPPSEDDAISVIAMGDMLPHDSVNANALGADGAYNYAQFFSGIQSQLDAADVTFCNQEVPSAGVELGISGYPTFNAPAEFARDLREGAGCDLVNTATNHTADKGTAGIAATRGVWDGLTPAIVSGANRDAAEQRAVTVFEEQGVKIALVSFAEYSNAPIDGVSLNMMGDTALVTELLTEARAAADVVIVSAHWGTEDSHEVNDAQRAFAQQVADLGADVVVGTGPHVLQPVAWLDRVSGGRTLVWYSIGNMLNTQLELDQRTGVIAGFTLDRDDAGAVRVTKPTAMLTYMHYDWTAEQEAANDLLARTNLSITPLAGADALLQTTRFGVSAADQLAASSAILGPDVTVVAE
ncbi:poly-gamma-glutamate synthesis protein (capsule biosynthesis protein) [Leucobacter luti]|uniref:Poly-gamma-glutamate synthesis protein (Capsule biosynthesis protein) n=1 Tax=Leucobacter luti TaxID=340320 RepID=A0A4R6S8X8_9MICO|nr:CapA family protein [Leucobacter luti]TDP95747.1 poly-gamma-glutamate synthesis protein (capsule biosynthesis protein) [Leucobacter luti]